MKTLHYISLLGLAMLLSLNSVAAQEKQFHLEKVYAHTDRPLYYPGEYIWFKAYVTGVDNKASRMSQVVFADLISPKGTVVSSKRLEVKEGSAFGEFLVEDDWVGGRYQLRMHTYYQKNFGTEAFYTKELVVQKVVLPKLLMKLDFDRKAYGKGAQVTGRFEVKDLENNPLSRQKISAQLMIQGTAVQKLVFTTDPNGVAAIRVPLPADLSTNDVVLNLLVNNKGSTESLARSVPVVLDNIDLQFLPEGGQLLNGFRNVVAFKALNEFGKPADVQGTIFNSSNQKVASFSSFHDGMGRFDFTPEADEQYYARIHSPLKSDSLYALPSARRTGARIQLFEQNENELLVDVQSVETFKGRLRLVNALQKVLLDVPINQRNSSRLHLPFRQMDAGIYKLQLLNKEGLIVSERLVLGDQTGLRIELALNKAKFGTRERVELRIKTRDQNNKPVSANLSIAVTDNKLQSYADDHQDNIYSYFLLSSELQGRIHEPSFYFDPQEKKAKAARDLVLLTHGWRSYVEDPLDRIRFLPDQSDVLNGHITDLKGNPISAKLYLFGPSASKQVMSFSTDDQGNFSCQVPADLWYHLVAFREDGKRVKIAKGTIEGIEVISDPPALLIGTEVFSKKEGAKKKKLKISKEPTLSTSLEDDATALSEVVVSAMGISRRAQAIGIVRSSVEDKRIIETAGEDLVSTLTGLVSGVQITQSSGVPGSSTSVFIRGTSSIRGSNRPLIIVDGVPLSQTANASSEALDIDPSTVQSLHVLSGLAAKTLYGSRGANGVLLISTYAGAYIQNGKRVRNKKFKNYAVQLFNARKTASGYNRVAHFYKPVYDGIKPLGERTDFRKTILWNPVVQTDEKGEALINYYNSDEITSFLIDVEGVSATGQVGKAQKTYRIVEPFTVTTKIPAYAALGDTICIPLTLTNNTSDTLWLKSQVEFPKGVRYIAGRNFPDSVLVKPNSFEVIPLELKPNLFTGYQEVSVQYTGADFADGFTRGIEIISPYFPVETAISGSEGGIYTFDRSNVVPHSSTVKANIYLDIVGDLMNGLEGILRHPYGCFEQASSATYPNIMVLKYLRETGKSDPEIEKKALSFIKSGYDRLTGFESKDGGFEWFGSSPAHETLTAYGLLEFTEMKEVYPNVSEPMMNRTKKWLLSRRDGKGGFLKSKLGYDSFASAPVVVANAYIVYAMSEVGAFESVSREYTAAYEEAIASKDSYRMALMALASDKGGQEENYQKLLEELLIQIKDHGFENLPVENSVTRSYGDSKQLETAALVVQALLRKATQMDELMEGINYITSKRNHGRFGSTQSTVLCLKTLIDYALFQKNKLLATGGEVRVVLNGNEINYEFKKENPAVIVMDQLEKYLTEGEQRLEVRLDTGDFITPYAVDMYWETTLPQSAKETPITVETMLKRSDAKVGDVVRMNVEVTNTQSEGTGMVTAMIGIPGGLSTQPYQLKELLEKKKVDYYEVFDNRLVLYWRSFGEKETKSIQLDLKAEFSGSFTASASAAYLYYGDEYKSWVKGCQIKITP